MIWFESLFEEFFVDEGFICLGGVEEGDFEVEGVMDCVDGFGVIVVCV